MPVTGQSLYDFSLHSVNINPAGLGIKTVYIYIYVYILYHVTAQ